MLACNDIVRVGRARSNRLRRTVLVGESSILKFVFFMMCHVKAIVFLFLLCSVIYSCADRVKEEDSPDIFSNSNTDENINRATEAAKKSIITFDSALNSGNLSSDWFFLKS